MTTTTARTTNTMRYGIDVVVAGRIYLLFCCRNTLFGIDFTRHLREKMPSKREDETPPLPQASFQRMTPYFTMTTPKAEVQLAV